MAAPPHIAHQKNTCSDIPDFQDIGGQHEKMALVIAWYFIHPGCLHAENQDAVTYFFSLEYKTHYPIFPIRFARHLSCN